MVFNHPDGDDAETPREESFRRPGDDLSPEELPQAIREYAETVDIDVPLDNVQIEISNRLQRAAGKAIKRGNSLTMRFAWKAYQSWGWNNEFEGVIRHELVHIWEYHHFDDGGHGRRFKQKAREVDAPRHCPEFAEDEAKWYLVCEECGEKTPRFRRSKVIDNPDPYRTRCCRARLRVEEA